MSVTVVAGQTVTTKGTGFGKDVALKAGPIPVPQSDVNRIDQETIQWVVPVGLSEGLHDLAITNVLAETTWTEFDAINVACDLELLELILRGDIGGNAHPLAELVFIDDDGSEVDISNDIESLDIVQKRDDKRTDLALLVPPAATLDVNLFNVDKRYTPGAGGLFDGKLDLGRVFKVRVGYFVGGVKCLFPQGQYLLDDPDFQVSPGARAVVTARDKLSISLDRKISMRSFNGRADEYITEVLEKIGITAAETIFPETVLSFVSTPVFINTLAIEILSEVLTRLQTEKSFRLMQIDDTIRLLEIPQTGIADIVFHFKRDMKSPFSRKERSNQSRVVTTVTTVTSPTVTADQVVSSPNPVTLTEADFTGSPKRKTLTLNKAIRIEWRQPGNLTQDFVIKEVARTPTSITYGMVDESDTGTINVRVRGDETSAIAGEAGPGIDQGGAGLGMTDAQGNELNLLLRRRGKTITQKNGFVNNDSEAQDLADALHVNFGAPVREMTVNQNNANPTLRINDLFRGIEKYSEDLSLFHMGEIAIHFEAKPVSLTGRIVGQFANIIEAPQKYDKAFLYNQGRIYDEAVGVGNSEEEDLSFRGAVVTRIR